MKYTGRIFTLIILLILEPIYITHYYNVLGYIDIFQIIPLPLLFIIVWFAGKQYDKVKFYSQELNKSKMELQQIFDSVDATLWSFDIHTNSVIISAGIEKIWGLSHENFLDNPMLWQNYVHPNDIKLIKIHKRELFSGKKCKTVYRIFRLDGEIRWIEDHGTPIFDSNGKLIRINGVVIDITENKKAEEKTHKLAYYDALTGLPNRYLLNDYLKESLARSKQNKQKMGVIFIDLDRFKIINDTMGHSFGDLLLQQSSNKLRKCVREDNIISRYGGDEFIILLENTEQEEVSRIAQRIIDEFNTIFMLNNCEVYISPSIGISMYPTDGDDEETLIKNADMAMYQAKAQGKNNYQFYNPKLLMINSLNMNLQNGLRKALEHNQFILNYQPQVELDTGKIVCMESLIRWQHPNWGLVPPADFIPLAEETGLIIPIGKWVLETACKQCKAWQEAGLHVMCVAVNISPFQLQQSNFIKTIIHILEETKLEPQYLELEITESIMQNIEKSTLILNKLKEIGVKISIDDFGTGYSSLSILKDLPIDKIKIDKSFTQDMLVNKKTAELVKTIIDMGNKLNFQMIAEGIENDQQVTFLKQNKCTMGQGYFFGRPLPSKEILKKCI